MPVYELPWPPSVNHYWGHTKTGQTYLKPEGRQYHVDVLAAVLQQGRERCEGRLSVSIELHPPNRIRFDVDNKMKATLDSLGKAGIYDDDEQIDELRVRRHNPDGSKVGYVLVSIASYPSEVTL